MKTWRPAAVASLASVVVATVGFTQAQASRADAAASQPLTLSATQKRRIVADLSGHALAETMPGYTVKTHALLPDIVVLHQWPSRVADDVPSLRPYRYALLNDALLVVNPETMRVVAVVSR